MIIFLIKKFVKDYENTADRNVREGYGILASIVGILCNALLFAAKLCVGIILNNVSVMADSFNNLADSGTSVVTLIGFKMGNKPADAEHPFGHGRVEYLSSLVVAFFIMMMGYEFFKTSISKIMHPGAASESIHYVSVFILFLTISVKLWMAGFNSDIGRRINSKALQAASLDARNDVMVTSVAIISVFIEKFAHITVDGYAGVFVAAMLLKSGWDIAKDTLSPLLGESADPKLAQEIKEFIEGYEGIVGSHDLIVHNYGPNISMASIHAEVPIETDIVISHEIIDRIEKDAAKHFGVQMVIHMDPVAVNDERIRHLSQRVESLIDKHGGDMSAHDFRLVNGIHEINFIFDLIVPYEYDSDRRLNIAKMLQDEIREVDPRYNCIINVENGFVGRWQHGSKEKNGDKKKER